MEKPVLKGLPANWPALLLAVLLLGVMAVAGIRRYQKYLFPQPPKPVVTQQHAREWLDAVNGNNEKPALLRAAEMVNDEAELPDPDYIRLVLQLQFNTRILTSPFNHFDYLRWQDASAMARLFAGQGPDKQDAPAKLADIYRLVAERIKYQPGVDGYRPAVSCRESWTRQLGTYSEICRVLFALAEQAGYEGMLVSVHAADGRLLHNICEFHFQGASYVIDVKYGKFWPQCSIAGLAADPSRLQGLWPPEAVAAIKHRVYRLPAEPADFRRVNRELAGKFSGLLKPFPAFGDDPRSRIDAFRRNYAADQPPEVFTYWDFPFHTLKQSPVFPAAWQLKSKQ